MKDTFTFLHDYNASEDPKMQDILFSLGPEGIGVYWMLIEMLYAQGGKLLRNTYGRIAYVLHASEEVVKKVVEDFGLFSLSRTEFWSERVLFQLDARRARSESARNSISVRWEKWKKAHAQNADSEQVNKVENYESNTNVQETKNNSSTKNENRNTLREDKLNKDNNNISKDISVVASTTTAQKPLPPFDDIALRWNRMVQESGKRYSKVAGLTEARKSKMAIRWNEMAKVDKENGAIGVYDTIIQKIKGSDFLGGDNRSGWKCSFDWIFENSSNWMKVYEGNFDNHNNSSLDSSKGRMQKVNDGWDRKSDTVL